MTTVPLLLIANMKIDILLCLQDRRALISAFAASLEPVKQSYGFFGLPYSILDFLNL